MTHDRLKDEIRDRFSEKLSMPFSGSRARFENKTHGVRLVISVSRRYENTSDLYWYGFNQSQNNFLNQAKQGYFIMGFSDSERAFAIPHEKMNRMAKEMSYTDYESGKNYHVHIRLFEGIEVIYMASTDSRFEFLQYEF